MADGCSRLLLARGDYKGLITNATLRADLFDSFIRILGPKTKSNAEILQALHSWFDHIGVEFANEPCRADATDWLSYTIERAEDWLLVDDRDSFALFAEFSDNLDLVFSLEQDRKPNEHELCLKDGGLGQKLDELTLQEVPLSESIPPARTQAQDRPLCYDELIDCMALAGAIASHQDQPEPSDQPWNLSIAGDDLNARLPEHVSRQRLVKSFLEHVLPSASYLGSLDDVLFKGEDASIKSGIEVWIKDIELEFVSEEEQEGACKWLNYLIQQAEEWCLSDWSDDFAVYAVSEEGEAMRVIFSLERQRATDEPVMQFQGGGIGERPGDIRVVPDTACNWPSAAAMEDLPECDGLMDIEHVDDLWLGQLQLSVSPWGERHLFGARERYSSLLSCKLDQNAAYHHFCCMLHLFMLDLLNDSDVYHQASSPTRDSLVSYTTLKHHRSLEYVKRDKWSLSAARHRIELLEHASRNEALVLADCAADTHYAALLFSTLVRSASTTTIEDAFRMAACRQRVYKQLKDASFTVKQHPSELKSNSG
eukprot:TRINITY_DN11854_c0_g2_i3.p1 TRINITY_DN11854_c0_g2~~TRINITY_DN11854_c0_g2_i3.p1  ORF type:complete len:548 (+),score=76.94 TRINITY_DN11854_c0_g2_i3:32-1645(+)